MKDGVPEGKYTAILEGNLHTTKGVEKPLNSPKKWIILFLSIRAITNMLSPKQGAGSLLLLFKKGKLKW
ncbi:hypothetical protein W5M_00993 [Corynebacterium diphtheriae bv. intermedius str. NCTC 5011]|nr:hypothetical protein W5M_00993 [Corynebacterium diphtheriae bv. intermedius str. NCTC 5011]